MDHAPPPLQPFDVGARQAPACVQNPPGVPRDPVQVIFTMILQEDDQVSGCRFAIRVRGPANRRACATTRIRKDRDRPPLTLAQ